MLVFLRTVCAIIRIKELVFTESRRELAVNPLFHFGKLHLSARAIIIIITDNNNK